MQSGFFDLQRLMLVRSATNPRPLILPQFYAGQTVDFSFQAGVPTGDPTVPYALETISALLLSLNYTVNNTLVCLANSDAFVLVDGAMQGSLTVASSLTIPANQVAAECSLAVDISVEGDVPHIETRAVVRNPTFAITIPAGAITIGTAPGTIAAGDADKVGGTLYVDAVNGSDSTGARGRRNLPFLSIAAAISGATSGDTIQLYSGTYTVTNIVLPSGVSLAGAGMMNTVIQSASGTGCVVVPGNNSLIKDLTIQATGVWPAATYPLGSQGSQPAFSNAVFSSLRILGDTDGIYVTTAGCSFRAYNCILSTFWDVVVLANDTADLYDCELTSNAALSTWQGHTTINSHGISGSVNGGRARMYGGRINCSGATGGNTALVAASGFVIEAYGVVTNVVAASGTGLDADASGGFPTTSSIRIANVVRQDGGSLQTAGPIVQLAPNGGTYSFTGIPYSPSSGGTPVAATQSNVLTLLSGSAPTLTGTNFTGIPENGVTGLTTDLAAKAATATTGILSSEAVAYQARVLAASDTLTADEIRIADTFIAKGKADGWWAAGLDINLFMGRTLTGALCKLKYASGGATSLTNGNFVASDFSPTVGIAAGVGNSTKYLDTGLAVNTNSLAYNNISLAIVSTAEHTAASGYMLNDYSASASDVQIQADPIVTGGKNTVNSSVNSAYCPETIVMSSGTLLNVWVNGILQNSLAPTSATLNGTMQLFRTRQFSGNYFSAGTCGAYYVGTALTTAQAQSLNDALTTAMISLGRLKWSGRPNMVFFGDSITYGDLASVNGNRWTRKVARALQVNELNAGAETRYLRLTVAKVPGGYQQLSDVTRLNPQYVTVMLGTNDMVGTDVTTNGDATILSDYESKYESMISAWTATGAKVLVASAPYNTTCNATKLAAYTAQAALAASNQGVPFVDLYRAISDKSSPSTYMSGANHPNDAGHVLVAQRIIEAWRGRFFREVTLDFASIAANASSDQTGVVFLGARVGDPISVTPPASLEAGLTVSAFVTASDTVTVRIVNATTGAIDPASNVYLLTLFRPQ